MTTSIEILAVYLRYIGKDGLEQFIVTSEVPAWARRDVCSTLPPTITVDSESGIPSGKYQGFISWRYLEGHHSLIFSLPPRRKASTARERELINKITYLNKDTALAVFREVHESVVGPFAHA